MRVWRRAANPRAPQRPAANGAAQSGVVIRNFNDLESDRNFIEISILKFLEFQDHFLEVLSDPRLS